MAKRLGGLGTGLDALLSSLKDESAELLEINVDDLTPNPYQPRKEFDETSLNELAESIKVHGLLQPLLVRRYGDSYQIVAGERRWRACKLAGIEKVQASIRELNDTEMMSLALVENIQRENLNVIEEALSYRQLMLNCSITQDELAKQLGKSRPSVANTLRILNLPEEIQNYIVQGLIMTGHAKVLLGVISKDMQLKIAEKIVAKGLSVRETEQFVKDISKPRGYMQNRRTKDVDIIELENEMQRSIGSKVNIIGGAEKGKIVIEYYSSENFDAIIELLRN